MKKITEKDVFFFSRKVVVKLRIAKQSNSTLRTSFPRTVHGTFERIDVSTRKPIAPQQKKSSLRGRFIFRVRPEGGASQQLAVELI